MAALYRIRTLWTGFAGAPGYSNHYFVTTDPLAAGAQTAANDLKAFWNVCQNVLPNVVTLTIDPAVATIDEVSSAQIDEVALSSPPAANTGIVAGPYASPAGMCVTWNTSSFLYGRRVRGRTYVVPIASSSYATGGVLTSTIVSATQTAAQALIAGTSNFVVYTRKREFKAADPAKGTKEVSERPGAFSAVTSALVRPKVAVLTSRRD
jgi:hypothetical protein